LGTFSEDLKKKIGERRRDIREAQFSEQGGKVRRQTLGITGGLDQGRKGGILSKWTIIRSKKGNGRRKEEE